MVLKDTLTHSNTYLSQKFSEILTQWFGFKSLLKDIQWESLRLRGWVMSESLLFLFLLLLLLLLFFFFTEVLLYQQGALSCTKISI